MLQKTAGVVLHTIKYNDSSNITDIYTEMFGRTSFIVSIPKSHRSAVKTALFQPLALVEIETDFHTRRPINRIKQAKLLYPFCSIPFDRSKTTIAFFLAEFMMHALREESENKELFLYLKNSITWLDNCEKDFVNFHLVFLMHLSQFIGFYPDLRDYHQGDYFDLENSCYMRQKPINHTYYLEASEAAQVSNLMRMNYNSMHLFGMSRAQRNRCIEVIMKYYRFHLPEFPELKSLEILRELYD
jgi:DNA repair protein RecO (recombination protein O)